LVVSLRLIGFYLGAEMKRKRGFQVSFRFSHSTMTTPEAVGVPVTVTL